MTLLTAWILCCSPSTVHPRDIPPAAAVLLQSWIDAWRRAVPGLSVDSLRWTREYAIAPTPGSDSPLSLLPADECECYRVHAPGRGALWLEIGSGGEPDMGAYLLDGERGLLFRLGYFGTVGGFDDAFWIDTDEFAFTSFEDVLDTKSSADVLGVRLLFHACRRLERERVVCQVYAGPIAPADALDRVDVTRRFSPSQD